MKIRQILEAKSRPVVTVRPDAAVADLLELLARHNIGAVVVSASGDTVDGIVSERDVVRRIVDDADLLRRPVSAIMTTQVETLGPDADLASVHEEMTEHRIRHLPVVEDGRLVGIISIGDVVKSHIDQVTFERDQLDSYVNQ